MGVDTGTQSQLLLLKVFTLLAAGAQHRMKALFLAALVSQVVGRPQQLDYQPGNAQQVGYQAGGGEAQQGGYQPGNSWSNTRPAQPTEWSAWSSVGSGAPSPYNSYNSYNPSYNPSQNPYNSYNPYASYVPGGNKQPYLREPYIPGGNKQPYLRAGDVVNTVPGSVGGPAIQDIGLNQQGSSLNDVETTRGDIGEPQLENNGDGYQGWNTLLKSLRAAWTKASAPASPHASTNATAPTFAY